MKIVLVRICTQAVKMPVSITIIDEYSISSPRIRKINHELYLFPNVR